MNADEIWSEIISCINELPIEIITVPSNNREPLWFSVCVENGDIFVQNASGHMPSTKMSKKRKITKRDFDTVYAYYKRWANGERNLRQEVRMLSRNTAYIFALIAYFE